MPHALADRALHVEHVMGTVVSFDLRDAPAPEDAIAAVVAWLHAVDARFSTYREDSEVRRLARGELSWGTISADLAEVLGACGRLHRATGGAFDAHATGRLDPSALVKGWAVDRAGALLAEHGIERFCLTAGGDVLARGGDPAWRVGIQHPRDRDALCATVAGRDLAVATSGLYERGAHLLDPRTGAAPDGLLSVTVCGPTLGLADAWSTALFAAGRDAPARTATLPPGLHAMVVLDDDRVLRTPGFPPATQEDPA